MCLNPEERERDRAVREQAVAGAPGEAAASEAKRLIGNSVYRRYLKVDG